MMRFIGPSIANIGAIIMFVTSDSLATCIGSAMIMVCMSLHLIVEMME
jgi:hypothetical protein